MPHVTVTIATAPSLVYDVPRMYSKRKPLPSVMPRGTDAVAQLPEEVHGLQLLLVQYVVSSSPITRRVPIAEPYTARGMGRDGEW